MSRASSLPLLVALAAAACGDSVFQNSGNGPPIGFAQSYGIWPPGPRDDCTAEVHNSYSVVGPDRKLYPTWHPPVDPVTGCSFGHDHGRDPRGSALYAEVGPIPFGYANEQLDVYDPGNPRHEDHFGHKIEWENDVLMRFGSAAAGSLFEIRCDVLAKLHQGPDCKDAFSTTLHGLAYHLRCTDGTRLDLPLLAAIGNPGQFDRSCDGTPVVVGPATPANSPSGGGRRIIPDRTCVDQFVLVPPGQRSDFGVLHESWQLSLSVRAADGHGLAFLNPYFQVFLPSRFYDPAATNLVGRPIDVCYEVTPSGARAQGEPCDQSTGAGTVAGVTCCGKPFGELISTAVHTLSRRTFLRAGAAAGGGLLVSFSLPARIGTALAAGPQAAREFKPNGFVRIDRDGGVTLVMHKVEMGQGTYTSMPMLLAEELEVDLSQVRLEHAPPDDALYAEPLFGVQETGGSTSVRGNWEPLRRAGATAP